MKTLLTYLGFDPTKHVVKTEILAGITTFLTMSYILAVNPLILGDAGMDKGAVFSATIIAAAVATLVMAFYAKLPYALASGMGLNAFFAYTLVLVMGYSWEEALSAVLLEGIVFIILTSLKVREAIVNAIPLNLRYAISVGIGLFIAYIGLKNGGVIVANESTITTLGPWNANSILAISGVILGGILLTLKVRGALFFTIIAITIFGIPLGVTQIPEDFNIISIPSSIEPIAFKFDFSRLLALDIDFYIVVFVILLMDLFDTLGTFIGAATSAGMVDENGKIKNMNKALMADAIGTTVGAICGTSTVTTYVESTTGGGRTGLTSLTVAVFFLIALFFSPLFLIIPSAATTSALVLVGIMMFRSIKNIDFTRMSEALPCFITIVMMPFTASISEGIVLGMLSYVFIKLLSGKTRDLSVIMYILAAFFILKYVVVLL